eukprot:scaffold3136_cov161-Amphora_coffeaeformis.AAC.5
MGNMFYRAQNFTSDLSAWDVSRCANFVGMFREANNFNSDLNSWDVSRAASLVSSLIQISVAGKLEAFKVLTECFPVPTPSTATFQTGKSDKGHLHEVFTHTFFLIFSRLPGMCLRRSTCGER